jgi:hypothetical protein
MRIGPLQNANAMSALASRAIPGRSSGILIDSFIREGILGRDAQEIAGKRGAEPNGSVSHESRVPQTLGFLCYNLIHSAGTDALVTFAHGVHGVRFASDF